jgi:hypothetical protein
MRPWPLLAFAGGSAVALCLAVLAPAPAAGEDLPPDVRRAVEVAAAFPAPTKALGFLYLGTGKRADGTEVELSVRAEPTVESGLPAWRVTEIWGAKAGAAGARRTVECVLAPDLTPLRGSTFEDGTSRATRVEWLGGDKALAVQVSGSGKRLLRTAWYSGQPLVELGAALLWCRLAPRETPPCRAAFGAPSWNRLTGEAQGFQTLQLEAGPGPDIRIQEPNAPEITEIQTWVVQGAREDRSPILKVLLDAANGLPRMVTIGGTTYGGETRPL